MVFMCLEKQCSTPPLRSFPSVAFETVPMLLPTVKNEMGRLDFSHPFAKKDSRGATIQSIIDLINYPGRAQAEGQDRTGQPARKAHITGNLHLGKSKALMGCRH